MWECCTACGGIALKCRTITHEDVARSGISFFCLRVCCCGCGCVCVGLVGTMAAACGCHFVLLENMLPRLYVCVVSGTMCRRLCDCRMEGEEWRELRECSGQESRWVSRRGGDCPPSPAPLLSGTLSLSHCRIVIDAGSTQRGSGCRHRHECDRKGTLQLLRSEGAICVAQWRAHNPLADSAQDTGHWPRSVCVMGDTAAASLLLSGGRTPVFTLFPTQADGCAMAPQQNEAFVFTMEGHYL
ncbi:hypothetical protein TcCL_Unassigned01181 [Trypanosoma cruzi]|nr:hypothetical protein TcCL_Unassigned01181 [Trypanosoma cruzi]